MIGLPLTFFAGGGPLRVSAGGRECKYTSNLRGIEEATYPPPYEAEWPCLGR